MSETKNAEISKKLFLVGLIAAILVSSLISTIITMQFADTLKGPKGDKGDRGETGPIGPATVFAQWDVHWKTVIPISLQWGSEVGTSQFASTFDYNWGSSTVFSTYSDYIGLTATMQVRMQRDGPVTLTIGSEDGSRLYIDGMLWLDNWNNAGIYRTKSATINPFVQGYHTLVMEYYKITGTGRVSFACDSNILMWNP